IKKIAFNTDQVNVWKAYIQEKTLKNTQTDMYLSWAIIGANLFKPSQNRLKEIENILNYGQKAVNQYLNNRLIIFPVHHSSAPKHGDLRSEEHTSELQSRF